MDETQLFRGLLAAGDWAVMGNGGLLHLAETVAGLPRGRALCGAVGTAFVFSSSTRASARLCERCADAARTRGASSR